MLCRFNLCIYVQSDTNRDPYYIFALEDPRFANGTVIPNGQYRILLSALKVTGDPSKGEDYERWLSGIVGVEVLAES